MNYKLSKLGNGVRVLTIPMPTLESAAITIWVKTGSRDEEEKTRGISHFLEHMVFKGSSKYKTAKVVSETIDALGAENNAGTSKEWTNFWIKTASINLSKAFDVLADVVLNPLLKQKEIDRERGVIYEEIAMYEDTPIMDIGEEFESLIYKNSKLGWKIAGDKKSLPNVNRDEFEKYRSKNYLSENILISVSGGVKEQEVEKLAESYFSGIEKSEAVQSVKDKLSKNLTLSNSERVYLKTKKNADQAHLMLGFLTAGKNYEGRFPQSLMSTILGRGMSSRLFTEVREKRGLAYSVRASIERFADTGNFHVYAGVAIPKIEETIKVILAELQGLATHKKPIGIKEFEKAKSFIKGKIALGLEDSEAVNDFFSEQVLFDKKILTPKDIYKKVDEVTIDEIYGEAEKLFSKDSYLAIIGPYEDRSKFIKILK
jgi:predicted Zn-dependent peptidase